MSIGLPTNRLSLPAVLFWSMCLVVVYAHCDEIEPPVIVTSTISKLPVIYVSTTTLNVGDQNTTVQAMDMLRGLPGIAVSQSGQRGSLGQIRVRGAEADHLTILIDGIEVNDPGSELNWGTMSSVGVNRIEVFNGPRSAVWGDHALAGVINLDTLPTDNQTNFLLGAGTQETTLVQFERERVTDDVFSGISIKQTQSEGGNASFVGDETDGFEQLSANYIGGRSIGSWHFQVNARGNETLSEYDPSGRDADRHITANRQLYGFRVEHFSKGSVKPAFFANHSTNETRNYADQLHTNSAESSRTHLTFSNALSLASFFESLIAIEHTRETFSQRGDSPFGNPNQDQHLSSLAFVVENALQFDSVSVHTSLRYDKNSDFENTVTWNATISLKQNNLDWFWTSGLGVKNPSFIDRFGYFPDMFVGNPELRPEEAIQHEAGIQVSWHMGFFKIVAFTAKLNDEIYGFAYDPIANAFTARNIDESSNRAGYEVSGSLTFDRYVLQYSCSQVDSEENSEPEIRRPRHLAGLWFELEINDFWLLYLSANYTGEQLDRDVSQFPSRLRTLSDYTLVNAHLQRRFGNGLNVQLRGENLIDKVYQDVYSTKSAGLTLTTVLEHQM